MNVQAQTPSPAAEADAHTLHVQPLIEWTRPDGSRTTERSGHWLLKAPPRGVSELAPHQRRRVLFLLDVSASMPMVRGRTQDYPALVKEVTERAKAMLEPYRGTSHMVVSLYTFGDLRREGNSWTPFVKAMPEATEISVDEALSRLDTFIPSEPKAYDEAWTYVSASIFEAIRRELNLDKDPSASIPNDAPPLTVFVFTDAGEDGGGESHARNRSFNNAPYAKWLKRHQDSNQIDYHYWDLGSDLVQMAPAKDKVSYVVSWGQGGRVDTVNRQGALSQHRRTFDVPPVMTATPTLANHSTQAGLRCPARESEDTGALERATLHLTFQGEKTFNLGDTNSYAVGQHALRLDVDSLCAELTRLYPNSEFILPQADEALAPLGFVEVLDQPSYRFELLADGTGPDTALPPLRANLHHQFAPMSRTYRMLSSQAEGVESSIDWTLTLFKDGAALEDASTLATLEVGSQRALTHALTPQDSLTLHVPAIEQRWYKFGYDFGYDDGAYELQLCASPRILKAPQPNYLVELSCPDCQKAHIQEHRICALIPLDIAPRPIAWWVWLGLALLLAWLTYVLLRYKHAPLLPKNLHLTQLEPPQGRRTFSLAPSKHGESTLTQVMMRYERHVRYLLIYEGAPPTFRSKFIPSKTSEKAANPMDGPLLTLAYRGSSADSGLQLYLCRHQPQISVHRPDGMAMRAIDSLLVRPNTLSTSLRKRDLDQGYVLEVHEQGRTLLKLVFHTKDFSLLDTMPQGYPRFEFPRT